MKIYRDHQAIELTQEEIEKAYREQELNYRKNDVKSHIEDIKENDDDPFIQKIELTEDDIEFLAKEFIEKYDCNQTENNMWNNLIYNYIDEMIE